MPAASADQQCALPVKKIRTRVGSFVVLWERSSRGKPDVRESGRSGRPAGRKAVQVLGIARSTTAPDVQTLGRANITQGEQMVRRSCFLALVLFGAATRAEADPPDVLLVVVHDDPSVAGSLQQRLEARVSVAPEITLLASAEVASLSAGSAKTGSNTATIEALLDRAREAYHDDRASIAEAHVGEAAALLKQIAFPPFDRARILLWRTALLAKKDEVLAEGEARKLLRVAPDYQVDLDVFPPSLSKLIERVRASEPRAATVVLSGLPRGASAWIDGRPASQRWLVAPGSHWLHVEGPGFRSLDRPFDATGDVALSAGLAPAFSPNLGSPLVSFALGKELNDKERTEVWGLLFRAKADVIAVVARADGGLRARIFRGGPSTPPSGVVAFTSEGEKALSEWIVTSIVQGPARSAELAAVAASRAPSGSVTAHAGLAAVTRAWRVSSVDGGRFVADFSGAGPAVAGQIRWRNVVGDFRAGFVDFGSQRRSFELSDGSRANATGGSTASIRLDSGYRLALSRRDAAPSITAFAGGTFDRHEAGPLRDSTGDLHLLPSWQRYSVEVGGRGEVPVVVLAKVRPAVLRVQASASPWGNWHTAPAQALGSPRPFTSLSWGAAVDVGLLRHWRLALDYAGSANTIQFGGAGTAPVDPPLRRVTASERIDTLQLSLGKEF